MIREIEFKNNRKETLRGKAYVPRKYSDAIILLHGFPGSSTGKRSTRTATKLMALGHLVMTFDFSGSNISDGKFEDKLISREVKEVRHAIDFLKSNFRFGKLTLIGHSTGATVASLYAYSDRRISKLVLSGATGSLNDSARYDFSDEQVRDFWRKGHIRYKAPGYWVDGKRLKKRYYDEFFRLDIRGCMKRYRRQLLIIHGGNDEAMPVTKARELYSYCNRPKRMYIIIGADHRLSRKKWLDEYISTVDRFIKHKIS